MFELYKCTNGESLHACDLVECLLQAHVDDIHVICGCLKDFLRTLKEPLVTRALWKSFVEASGQHLHVFWSVETL